MMRYEEHRIQGFFMRFKTEYKIKGNFPPISHNESLLFTGSCFSENISSILRALKFKVLNNPFGTLYHPIPIFNSLILDQEEIIKDTFNSKGIFYNWNSHSDIRADSEAHLNLLIQKQLKARDSYIKKSSHLFLTFGSSKLYTRLINNKPVANCHKIPQKEFTEAYSTTNEILDSFRNFHQKLKSINENAQIILSVSPVRYLGDGFEMNQYNKSILIQACHMISQEFNNVSYFPAYEIFMDDLRDYRYYEKDLIHPNEMGIEYVYEIFEAEFAGDSTKALNKKIQTFNKGFNHKPFNPDSLEHKRFLQSLLVKGNELMKNGIDLKDELNQISGQL